MKNLHQWMFAAIFFCGLVSLTSCQGFVDAVFGYEDNPSGTTNNGSTSDDENSKTSDDGKYCEANLPVVWVFNRLADATSFLIKTNIEDITVVSSESWCTVSIENTGIAEQKQVTITVSNYEVLDETGSYTYAFPRKATIRVTAGNVFDETITIAQNTFVSITTPILENTYNTLYLPAGYTQDVTIKTNCYSWSATTDATWLTVSQKDYTTLTVTSEARTDDTPRSATVTITNDADELNDSHTFTVADADAVLTSKDYEYGEGTGWD